MVDEQAAPLVERVAEQLQEQQEEPQGVARRSRPRGKRLGLAG